MYSKDLDVRLDYEKDTCLPCIIRVGSLLRKNDVCPFGWLYGG